MSFAKEFPPLGGGTKTPPAMNGPSGVWSQNGTSPASGAAGSPSTSRSPSENRQNDGSTADPIFAPSAAAPSISPSRLDEHDEAFERPPPKGAAELFIPGPGSSSTRPVVPHRTKSSGSSSFHPSQSGSSAASASILAQMNSSSSFGSVAGGGGGEKDRKRGEKVASAILMERQAYNDSPLSGTVPTDGELVRGMNSLNVGAEL